jgi:hypothetical protein
MPVVLASSDLTANLTPVTTKKIGIAKPRPSSLWRDGSA